MYHYVLDDTDSIFGLAYTDGYLWYVDVWEDSLYSQAYTIVWEYNNIPKGYRIVSKEEMKDL